MSEQFANFATSTISASMDGTTDPITFTVVSATDFPGSGDFRVLIEAEILKVTGVSGADFTADRAQEGTAKVAHASGSQVSHVLTAGGLTAAITGGGGAAVDDPQEFVYDSTPPALDLSGSPGNVSISPTFNQPGSLPSWVNSSGDISEAGLYRIAWNIAWASNPSTNGAWALQGDFYAPFVAQPYRIGTNYTIMNQVFEEIFALASGDVPYAFSASLDFDTTTSALLNVSPTITRLVH